MTYLDPALRFLYKEMLKEQENLPESERVGFQAWCKRHGIMAPEDWDAVRKYEISISSLDGAIAPDEDY